MYLKFQDYPSGTGKVFQFSIKLSSKVCKVVNETLSLEPSITSPMEFVSTYNSGNILTDFIIA